MLVTDAVANPNKQTKGSSRWKRHAGEPLPEILPEIAGQRRLVAALVFANRTVCWPASSAVTDSAVVVRLAMLRRAVPWVGVRVAVYRNRTTPHLDVLVVCVHRVHPDRPGRDDDVIDGQTSEAQRTTACRLELVAGR